MFEHDICKTRPWKNPGICSLKSMSVEDNIYEADALPSELASPCLYMFSTLFKSLTNYYKQTVFFSALIGMSYLISNKERMFLYKLAISISLLLILNTIFFKVANILPLSIAFLLLLQLMPSFSVLSLSSVFYLCRLGWVRSSNWERRIAINETKVAK